MLQAPYIPCSGRSLAPAPATLSLARLWKEVVSPRKEALSLHEQLDLLYQDLRHNTEEFPLLRDRVGRLSCRSPCNGCRECADAVGLGSEIRLDIADIDQPGLSQTARGPQGFQ